MKLTQEFEASLAWIVRPYSFPKFWIEANFCSPLRLLPTKDCGNGGKKSLLRRAKLAGEITPYSQRFQGTPTTHGKVKIIDNSMEQHMLGFNSFKILRGQLGMKGFF